MNPPTFPTSRLSHHNTENTNPADDRSSYDSGEVSKQPKYRLLSTVEIKDILRENDTDHKKIKAELNKAEKYRNGNEKGTSFRYEFRLYQNSRRYTYGYIRFYLSVLVAKQDPSFSWESFARSIENYIPDIPLACSIFEKEFNELERLNLGLAVSKLQKMRAWREIIHKDLGLDLNKVNNIDWKASLKKHGVPIEELDLLL